jgi:integrase
MARKATGQIIPPEGKARSWAIRFRANGERHYETLGRPEEGWTRQKADRELRHRLADIERGLWTPETIPTPAPPERRAESTFGEFAAEWFDRHEPEWKPKTVTDYRWALELHLLPCFENHRLSEITIEEVDRYKAEKLREGKLGAGAINKTIARLAQLLEEAVEYGYLDHNAAHGRKRRVKASKPQRSWVEPEQMLALIEAADRWHRPIVATMIGSGLRVGEACALDWRDVNLATGTITVRTAKTDAGTRQVDLPAGLVDELRGWKARTPHNRPGEAVFISRPRDGKQTRQTGDNVGRRLKVTIKRANDSLDELGIEPISEKVTPHSLRRTYASVRAALRDDPVYIAEQIGHTDPRFTLQVYAKGAKRRDRLTGSYLSEFERALHWAEMGRIGEAAPLKQPGVMAPAEQESRMGVGNIATVRL